MSSSSLAETIRSTLKMSCRPALPKESFHLRRSVSAHFPRRIGTRLRLTFASLLLQQGESPQYVQRQLGHSSITLTADLYGK